MLLIKHPLPSFGKHRALIIIKVLSFMALTASSRSIYIFPPSPPFLSSLPLLPPSLPPSLPQCDVQWNQLPPPSRLPDPPGLRPREQPSSCSLLHPIHDRHDLYPLAAANRLRNCHLSGGGRENFQGDKAG